MDRNEIALRLLCAQLAGGAKFYDRDLNIRKAFRTADEFIAIARETAKPARCEVTDLRPSILDLGEVTNSERAPR